MKDLSKNILKMAYVTVFILALIIPGIWTFVGSQKTIGNEEEVDFSDADYWNISDKVDSFMNTKFGFRNKLVNLNNEIKYNVFTESGNSEVVVGEDGWLFFSGALYDYTGEGKLSDIQIDKIVKILSMVQNKVESNGSKFVFVSAPNKMEIYGEYMPYYHVEDTKPGNYELLFAELETSEVSFVDLKKLLKEQKELNDYRLYYKGDSHWNEVGAFIAYESIMEELELDYVECTKEFVVHPNAYKGDLDKMLFPSSPPNDEHIIIEKDYDFYYTSNFKSVDDLVIKTANDNKEGNLIMWRDSFGAGVYYMFAENFNTSEFRRELPYNLTNISDMDVVVIELVERNLPFLLYELPIIEPEEADVEVTDIIEAVPDVQVDSVSGYNLITAYVKDMPKDCINVYFRYSTSEGDVVLEAYPSAEDGDACLYLKEISEDAEISVIYEYNGNIYETLKNSVNCV